MKPLSLLLALLLCLASCTEADTPDTPETAYIVFLQGDLSPDDDTDKNTLDKIWGEEGVFQTLVSKTDFSRLKHLYVFTLTSTCDELLGIDPSVLTGVEYTKLADLSKQLTQARQAHESRSSDLQDVIASIEAMRGVQGNFTLGTAVRTVKVIYISDMLHHEGESNTQKGIFNLYSSFSFSQFKNQVESGAIKLDKSVVVLDSLFPNIEAWHVYTLRVPSGPRPEPQPSRSDIDDTWKNIFTQLKATSVKQNLSLNAETIKRIVAD